MFTNKISNALNNIPYEQQVQMGMAVGNVIGKSKTVLNKAAWIAVIIGAVFASLINTLLLLIGGEAFGLFHAIIIVFQIGAYITIIGSVRKLMNKSFFIHLPKINKRTLRKQTAIAKTNNCITYYDGPSEVGSFVNGKWVAYK